MDTPRSRIDRILSFIEGLKESDSLLLKIGILFFVISILWLLTDLSSNSRHEVATAGGTFTEGIVGTPRFVNPVLAVTRADKDLSALIFDGLMVLGNDGMLIPNVAESVTISEDGLTYNVILRNDVAFHNGAPLTAKDVLFTVEHIQDPMLTSPLRANFDGVRLEVIGDHEINFILPEPYAPFIENLTFGILPEHIWKDVSNEEFPFSQRNSEPIGSGPYTIGKIVRNASGIPETYILKPYNAYHRGVPRIETFTLVFFANETLLSEAFQAHTIDAVAGIDQSHLSTFGIDEQTHEVIRMPLPRTFALFFNQNRSAALRDAAARKALDTAIDRTALIARTLNGYALPLTGPVPAGFGVTISASNTLPETSPLDAARAILRDAGWKLNTETGIWEKNLDGTLTPLSFNISTINNPAFEETAEYISATWKELGVDVSVKQFEQSDLTQSIIRPRDYEALLFGTQVGRSLDLYSFWHSSQRNDPGLNIALYANITIDSILSEARTKTDTTVRGEALARFNEEILKENPAIFLYQPELLYIFPHTVVKSTLGGVSEPYERFHAVHTWYMETESVWPFFK